MPCQKALGTNAFNYAAQEWGHNRHQYVCSVDIRIIHTVWGLLTILKGVVKEEASFAQNCKFARTLWDIAQKRFWWPRSGPQSTK